MEIKAQILKEHSVNFIENKLLTEEVLNEIEDTHSLKILKTYKNILIKYGDYRPIEFDVLLVCETPSGVSRLVSIELKEVDVSKVIEQALTRRDFVDYSYVVLNTSIKHLVEYLLYVWNDYIKEYKIGFFINNDMILQSKFIKRKINLGDVDEKIV